MSADTLLREAPPRSAEGHRQLLQRVFAPQFLAQGVTSLENKLDDELRNKKIPLVEGEQ